MTKSQLCVKQIYLPSILSNITNNKNGFWKIVRRTNFHKNYNCIPFLSSRQSVHPCFLLYFALLFIPYLNVLSFYFCVSPNSVTGSHSSNFDKFSATAPFKESTSETSRLIIMLLYFVHAAWRAGRGNRATQVKTRGSRVPLLASRFKSSNAEKFGIH